MFAYFDMVFQLLNLILKKLFFSDSFFLYFFSNTFHNLLQVSSPFLPHSTKLVAAE